MRTLCILALAASVTGCNSWSTNKNLDNAYRAYERGDCEQVMLDLSRTERKSRARPWLQPEISMLRGLCLERQKYYVDAAQTYDFIIARYPSSEYAYRAKARLETLRQNGRLTGEAAQPLPVRP
ncbi:hypothetical protein SAMN05216577_12182 [Pseudomonas citronellolis]|uniref:Lipoprotein n=1 Tax=Pseudomonas citronellolis TaxID=53408 RepID=A0AAQ1HQE7_9PSED|nr:hypothetical protein [Pseudomonas citronellolis]MCP1605560.1 regulator of sirC expression with transglutaminase-like and TPR domain [Pseudomonas citronellolis]MCP1656731.1 regulator of sirC expression with transglutaminase-like and TPR domain [Pseudomonas citronellolis]MCP1724308.1 regulator of sirC expression with transglutaminase-like and TPR domain [Pseudomonas citronellolis]MDN6872140.1 hypothetical protein [Pseudomonas citronellolis]TGC24961.1 hypothetical protein CW310_21750 [Pseudomo